MQLNDTERRFLAKRTRLVRAWRYVGTVLLLALVGLGAWLFFSRPLLANPWAVMAGLEDGTIADAMLVLMAGMLPVVVLLCLVLAVAMVLFAFAAFLNERRYQQIIRRACDE
jgi:hypothetical protein